MLHLTIKKTCCDIFVICSLFVRLYIWRPTLQEAHGSGDVATPTALENKQQLTNFADNPHILTQPHCLLLLYFFVMSITKKIMYIILNYILYEVYKDIIYIRIELNCGCGVDAPHVILCMRFGTPLDATHFRADDVASRLCSLPHPPPPKRQTISRNDSYIENYA